MFTRINRSKSSSVVFPPFRCAKCRRYSPECEFALPRRSRECGLHLSLIGDIACVYAANATACTICSHVALGRRLVDVQNANRRSARRESSERSLCPIPLPPPVTTAVFPSSRNVRSDFSRAQSETPRFQGMKSSCDFFSALVCAFSARNLDHEVQNLSPICLDRLSPTDNRSGVDVDDVMHSLWPGRSWWRAS